MLRRLVGHGLSCVLALLSFAAGTALVRTFVPLHQRGQLGAKLTHLAEHGGDYDALSG
jgi:hypothetical protein